MKNIYTFALILLLTGCKDDNVGKYVYIDPYQTLHIDRACTLSNEPRKGQIVNDEVRSNGIKFIDTCNIKSYYSKMPNTSWGHEGDTIYYRYSICPNCVNDESFAHLERIMKRNEMTDPD